MIKIIIISILFILIEVIIFILSSKTLTDEEEMEARVLLVSEKMKQIFNK